MKHIALIVAFLFSWLAAMPCADFDNSRGDDCSKTEEVSSQGCSETHASANDTHGDDCSPFCSCHCCQTHSILTLLSEDAYIQMKDRSKDHFIASLFSKELFSIWHPPRA